jgi:beta-glucosidase
VPVSGKDRTPALILEGVLREKYFEPFRASIVEGGALSLMVNSGIINAKALEADTAVDFLDEFPVGFFCM